MTYPENIPAGSTAFDLAATAGAVPAIPCECGNTGTTRSTLGGKSAYYCGPCNLVFTPTGARSSTPGHLGERREVSGELDAAVNPGAWKGRRLDTGEREKIRAALETDETMPDFGVPLTDEAQEAWDRYRELPTVDPDCAAGKHTSCFGPPCQCAHHAVEVAVTRLSELTAKYGEKKAAVMLLTHLSAEDIDAVGGV